MKNMIITEVDNSNGVIFPFYDPDNSMIYLCGKVYDTDYKKQITQITNSRLIAKLLKLGYLFKFFIYLYGFLSNSP